jgi:hypothetical protein
MHSAGSASPAAAASVYCATRIAFAGGSRFQPAGSVHATCPGPLLAGAGAAAAVPCSAAGFCVVADADGSGCFEQPTTAALPTARNDTQETAKNDGKCRGIQGECHSYLTLTTTKPRVGYLSTFAHETSAPVCVAH